MRQLGSVLLEIQAGTSPDVPDIPASHGEWAVLKISAVQPDGLRSSENKAVHNPSLFSASIEVKHGDLLITRANTDELIGIACIVRNPPPRLMLCDKTLRLVVNPDRAIPDYVRHALALETVRNSIRTMASGTSGSMKNISQASIHMLQIPLPTLDVQRRIVEILHVVDSSITAAERLIEKLISIRGAILEQSISAAEADAHVRSLGEISTIAGEYGSNSPACTYRPGIPRYVRITDIRGDGSLSMESIVGIERSRGQEHLLQDGDLLIARTGFTLGKSYLYRVSDGECAFAGYLVRFRVDTKIALPEYVFLWTRSNSFQHWVASSIREVGQRNISAKEYARHFLPVPPVDKQDEIIRSVSGVRQTIACERAALDKLRVVKKGLMDDLFDG